MLPTAIAFSLIATAAVWFAGRRDEARDPRLTILVLGLLAIFPLLFFLPEWEVLPAAAPQESSSPSWTQW
ncbi:MAG: hypothetical protein EOP83_10335, partial [Verrucomicrobiaceae bacterium]